MGFYGDKFASNHIPKGIDDSCLYSEAYIEEFFRLKSFNKTKLDPKDISYEDIDDPAKLKRIIFTLLQEDDEKIKEKNLYTFITDIITFVVTGIFVSTGAYSIALPIGTFFIIFNTIISSIQYSQMSQTSWERIADRVKKLKDKVEDKEDKKKLDKIIDKLLKNAEEVRDSKEKEEKGK